MPPAANRPGTPAEDVNLMLLAMACPAFRFGHRTFGGHGLRWLAQRKNSPGPDPHSGASLGRADGTQQPQHSEPGTRP